MDGYVSTYVTFDDSDGFLRTIFTQERSSVVVQLPEDPRQEDRDAVLSLINNLPELIRQATFEIEMRSMMEESTDE